MVYILPSKKAAVTHWINMATTSTTGVTFKKVPQTIEQKPFDSTRRQTRPLAITIDGLPQLNPINDDYFRVSSLQGQESISKPYEFNIELRADDIDQLSSKQIEQLATFDLLEVIGLWANVRIARPWSDNRFEQAPAYQQPDWENLTPSRFFQGVISSISMAAPGVYQLTLASPLHHLTLRNRYHIYHDCNVQTLFTQLLTSQTTTGKLLLDFRFDDSPTITRTQDWLQAGENDFAFLQRIMNHAAIYFYFIHQAENLVLVFSNRPTSLKEVDIPNSENVPLPLRYSYTTAEKLGSQQDDLFCDLNYQVKLMPSSSGTILTREQAEWEHNDVAGFTSYDGAPDEVTEPEYVMHHRYAYGTNLQEAKGQLKKVRQRIATEQGTLSGSSTSSLLSPGYTFELSQPIASKVAVESLMRQSFSQRIYVVTSIQHKVSDTEAYKGSIQATEVNPETDSFQGTLLTPFSMDGTQQGSVLAKVVKTAVPRGWRYREKSNFQVEQAQNQFEDEVENEKGCLVQFATARDSDQVFWVRLSQGSQTAPEVGAMVSVSRANNDSELPEFNVIASHGQKAIQPADRRKQSWTANTNWGSSYSTSYGDGISLRWGYSSPVNFEQAKTLVESAYDQPDMLGNTYDNSSFSRGGSYSVSTSNQNADGVSSASVSMGSNFSENHAKISYGFSDTGTSQNYSQVGKSVSRSVIGEYNGKADLDSPSFINGKVPEQSIIDIADNLNNGDTYNENHTKGRSISLSGSGAPPPSFSGTSAISYSDNITVGDTQNKSTHMGDSSSDSTHMGNSTNTSLNVGDNLSSSINIGNTLSNSLQLGNTVGLNTFLGSKNDVSTTLALTNSLSTNIGLTNQIDTYLGAKNAINTHISATNSITNNIATSNTTETSIGATNSTSTNISASNTTSTRIAASNALSTSLGASNNISTKISASNNVETNIGASNNTVTNISTSNTTETNLGLKNSTSTTLGMSMSTNINAAMSISDSIHLGMSIDNSTNAGIKIQSSNNLGLSVSNSVGASAIIVNEVAPIRINAAKPATEISTESLTKIEMLVMKISL